MGKFYIVPEKYEPETYWENRIKKYWGFNAIAPFNHPTNRIFWWMKKQLIKKWIKNKDIKSVIDIGCGTGYYTKILADNRYYLGIGISQTAIRKLKNKYKNKVNIDFLKADISNFHLRKKFDLVVALDILFHITNDKKWKEAIENIKKMSNKYILISETFEGTFKHCHCKPRLFNEYKKAMKGFKLIFKKKLWLIQEITITIWKKV